MSRDLEALLRWEHSGGRWQVVGRGPQWACVALLTCDGGEQMAEIWTEQPDVLAHLDTPSSTPDGPPLG